MGRLVSVSRARASATACALSVLLAGCGTISVPLGDVFGVDDAPQYTASTDATDPAAPAASDQSLPESLNAVAPVGQEAAEPTTTGTDQPVQELLASLQNQPAETGVRLSQSDLDAMGKALTHVLASETEPGTFAWAHEETDKSGRMTPFRRLSTSSQGACRVVSVEIERGDEDTIFLADACRQNDEWVFVTPRAGEVL